jgi:hypothetical protein
VANFWQNIDAFLQKSTKLAPFGLLMQSIGMVFCEDSENDGPEALNLPFGRVFPKSVKLAPFWPLMPSIGMVFCEDSENDGLEAQILHFGQVFPKSPKLVPFLPFRLLMPSIGTSGCGDSENRAPGAGSREIGDLERRQCAEASVYVKNTGSIFSTFF